MSDESERQYQKIVRKRLEQLVEAQIETNGHLEDIVRLLRRQMGLPMVPFESSSGTVIYRRPEDMPQSTLTEGSAAQQAEEAAARKIAAAVHAGKASS